MELKLGFEITFLLYIWRDHNVAMVATWTVESDVGTSQPPNNSLHSRQHHDGDDALHINEPVTTLHDIVPIVVHTEIANASSESNHPIQIEALHIPDPHMTPTPTTLGSASTSELHSQQQSQNWNWIDYICKLFTKLQQL